MYYLLSGKSISASLQITIRKRDHKLLEEFRVHFPCRIKDFEKNTASSIGQSRVRLEHVFDRNVALNRALILLGYGSRNENLSAISSPIKLGGK